MKFNTIMSFFVVLLTGFSFVSLDTTFAAELWSSTVKNDEDTGVFSEAGKTQDDIRKGNFSLDDIPKLIVSVIEALLVLAGSIAVVALIYHAVRMQLASGILWDSSWVDKAKKWMYSAMMWFILAMSAWFIMTKLVAIFAGII